VGETGKVIGIDMTEEQLKVAREYQAYHAEKFGFANTEFIHGFIEDFVDSGKVAENSADLIISNCVVNLSPHKDKVLTQVWKALKEGGELYFSDVYVDRRVPKDLQDDKVLWGECLSGALYFEDFRRLMSQIGFKELRIVSQSEVKTTGEYKLDQKYYSITVRAFKISSLEDRSEDYQNTITYKGGIPDFGCNFEFDQNYTFSKNKEINVCRNTAEIFRNSRYSKFFEVSEDGVHQGLHEKQSFTLNKEFKDSGCCSSTEAKSGCC
jgi:arsenite methyltransferase